MSEFKFACPVCGQHITASASASGTQLECPTCFQKIIVPQAPAGGDSKFILSATQVGKPRPAGLDTSSNLGPLYKPKRPSALPAVVLGVVVVGAAAAGYHFFRGKVGIGQNAFKTVPIKTNNPAAKRVVYPLPTNSAWTLNLTNAAIPDTSLVGSIHGGGFLCERASMQGGNLSLRQGRGWPPDLGVSILFFAQQAEELGGKTIEVTPSRLPPLPKVTLRWKDEHDKAVTQTVQSGYALKVVFGQVANKRISGKLYLGLPDDAKSFVAGSFDAEIRMPPPPKSGKPVARSAGQ
jgi:hypothetical protein